MAWPLQAVMMALLSAMFTGVVSWDEPLDAFMEDELFAELAAEDLGSDGALNLLQATAKLHHRGTGGIPDMGGGGSLAVSKESKSSLAAAVSDGDFESMEASTVSLVQQTASRTDPKGHQYVKKAQASRKVLLTKKEEL